MIKAKIGNTAILGLEEGNIKNLKEGKPAVINLKALGLPDITVVILYGQTQADIIATLEKDLGAKMPKITPKDGNVH